MASDQGSTEIDSGLAKTNEYFKSVIDLIPVDAYFKTPHATVKKQKKQVGKELGLRAKLKLVKRRKFDPQQMKTTSERITQPDNESDHDNDVATKKKQEKSDESSPSYETLQKRLKLRIEEIQMLRNPKNRSEEESEKIRARRRKERAKFKLKKRMKMHPNQAAEMQRLPGQKNAKPEVDSKNEAILNGTKPILNDQGKIVFSKFDFGEDPGAKKKSKKRKGGVEENLSGSKTLKSLLTSAESKKNRLEHLKLSDPDEAAKMTKKDSWEKALAKAEGTKIKDDPELLRKSLKKERSIKKQHAKKWKEREDSVKEKMQKRQDKRERNIQSRKDKNKDKKVQKRMKSFSKSVPGF